MILQMFPMVDGPLALLLLALAAAGGLWLLWWTWNRWRGDGTDPSLSYSKETDTGQASVLVSGVHAVALVGLAVAALAFPVVGILPAVVVIALVAIHWMWEREEAM